MRVTKAQCVLEYIGQHPQGLSFSSIQKFIVTMNGKDWDEKSFEYDPKTKARTRPVRRYRGYWCDYLTGPGGHYSGSKGLLNRFCIQHPNTKRWILTEQIKAPFAGEKMPTTKTQDHNRALAMGWQKVYEDNLPKCSNCQQKVHPYPDQPGKEWAPDKTAHMTSWHSGGAETDCRLRVWYKGHLTDATIGEFNAIRDAIYARDRNFEFASHTAEMWLKGKVIPPGKVMP